MKDIYVMPVTVASVPVSVLPAVLLLSCSIVIYYILWCQLLLLVSHGVILLLLPRTDIMSHTIIYHLLPSNFSTKNSKSCKVVFRSSGSLSTSSMVSSYAFCIHLISFHLFDTVPGFPSAFIPSGVNVRINHAVSCFGKEPSILSQSFFKSSILLVFVKFQAKIIRNLIVLFNYAKHYTEMYGDCLADLTLPQ